MTILVAYIWWITDRIYPSERKQWKSRKAAERKSSSYTNLELLLSIMWNLHVNSSSWI